MRVVRMSWKLEKYAQKPLDEDLAMTELRLQPEILRELRGGINQASGTQDALAKLVH